MKRLLLLCLLAMMTFHAQAQTKEPSEQPGSTGTVTFTYLGKKTALTTVRAKDGNIWLQQNLGSSRVATSYDDERAYGDLFQWGRWDDTHQLRVNPNTRNDMPEPNNPGGMDKSNANPYFYHWLKTWWSAGTKADEWAAVTPSEATATNGCDPCKALGIGWRLPTLAEWDTVLKREQITDINGSMYSNLKLPTSGQRDIQDFLITGQNGHGSYWSSTPANKDGYAKYAEINRGYISTEYMHYRSTGMSVRCIKSSKQ